MELTAGISRGWTLLQTVSLKPLHKHTYGPKEKNTHEHCLRTDVLKVKICSCTKHL